MQVRKSSERRSGAPRRAGRWHALLLLAILLTVLELLASVPGPVGSSHPTPLPSAPVSSSPSAPTSRSTSTLPGPLEWSVFSPGNGNPYRSFASVAAFRAGTSEFAEVVGGSGPCGEYCNDTWSLDFSGVYGPAWYQGGMINPGRLGASLSWDYADGELVLFGGLNGTLGALNDTWTSAPFASPWTQLALGHAPSPRWGSSMAYDPALGGVVLFGGDGGGGAGKLSDTWVFREGAWTQLSPATSPPARSGASLAWQSDADRLVLFGGNGTAGPLADTWAFSGMDWYPLHPATSPPARVNASTSSDGEGDPVLFGGRGATAWFNDTWVLFQDNWTELAPLDGGGPGPVEGALLFPNLGATPNDFLLMWGRGAQGDSPVAMSLRVWNGGTPPSPLPLHLAAAAQPANGTAPFSVSFQAYGEGGSAPYGYSWSFGDGSPGTTDPVPLHVYRRPGSYLATVYVRDSASPPQSANLTLTVVASAPSGGLSVSFTALPRSGGAPLAVNFSSSLVGGTPPYAYHWEFGDGSLPSGSPAPSHLYNSSGEFIAFLTVSDSKGSSANWSATVVVQGARFAVALTGSPLQGTIPLLAHFQATAGSGTCRCQYLWDFGDGGRIQGTSASVEHWFNRSGSFTVRVEAVTPLGTNATAELTVVAETPPPFVPAPPSALQRIASGVVGAVSFLAQPLVAGPILLALLALGVREWGVPVYRARKAVRAGLPPLRLAEVWGVAEVALVVEKLRERSGPGEVRGALWPLLVRDAKRLVGRLRVRPGGLAAWAIRRLLVLPAQLLIAATVLFLGLVVVPGRIASPPYPAPPSTAAGFLQAWTSFLSTVVLGDFSNPYLRAYLPYSLQFLGVIVVLSALLSYPLGLLSGWYRGRTIDQSTRAAGVLAFSIPVFVVALLTLGGGWLWYYTVSGGDTLLGSLPSLVWMVNNTNGIPPWVLLNEATSPTGFVLIDAPLHGAWGFEQVVLLKMLIQGLPIAALYSAIFLRFARLATEEAANELHLVGARARGLRDPQILWSHISRRISPIYVAVFATTFPILLFVQITAEWFYDDLGIGLTFVLSLGNPPAPTLGIVLFFLLLLITIVGFLAEGLSKALDPAGRSREGREGH